MRNSRRFGVMGRYRAARVAGDGCSTSRWQVAARLVAAKTSEALIERLVAKAAKVIGSSFDRDASLRVTSRSCGLSTSIFVICESRISSVENRVRSLSIVHQMERPLLDLSRLWRDTRVAPNSDAGGYMGIFADRDDLDSLAHFGFYPIDSLAQHECLFL